MNTAIDLRSDTVTKPTKEMRIAALEAVVGDDVYKEDPTVRKLEELAASLMGKEAALFVPTGTQGNQIAVLTHCKLGQEIILDADSHLFYYEGGAISAFAGVQPRIITGNKGMMNPLDVQAAIRDDDIHMPQTGLICLENTHNRAGGAIIPLSNMKEIHSIAQRHNIPVHLDGARLFNAAVAAGIEAKEFAAFADTVQFCLSKGLGAPVGSIVAGSSSFIQRARKWRKSMGGGMRQAGMIAAPGIVALRTMVDRLKEDHDNAKRLAEGLQEVNGLTIENEVATNIVLLNTKETGMTAKEFITKLQEHDVLAITYGPYTVRLTTHFNVTATQIETAIEKVRQMMAV